MCDIHYINSSLISVSAASCNQDMSNKSHENMSLGEVKRANPDELLPGFRFHPTDEELVGYYLRRKVMQKSLAVEVITQLDIYKFDPWDLPKMALVEGEKDWYFFCPRDRKYRNSARPNRVTGAGFWKATGTDRHIYASGGSKTIGLKKSLVFYKGRAPKALKTDWMMHEFRLPPNLDSPTSFHVPSADDPIPKDAWAICRIFKKSTLAQQRSASMITQQRHEQSSEGGLTVRTEDLDESETGFEPIQSEKKYFCNPNVDLDNDTSETRSETTSEDGSLSLQREDLHDKAIQFTNEESTANWPHLGLPSPESIDSSRLSENLWSTASLGMANDLFAHDFALRGDILDSVDSIPSVQPSSAIGIHSQYINVDARNLEMLEFEDFTMECTLDSGPKLGSAIYQYVEPFNRRKLSLQIPAYYCAM